MQLMQLEEDKGEGGRLCVCVCERERERERGGSIDQPMENSTNEFMEFCI